MSRPRLATAIGALLLASACVTPKETKAPGPDASPTQVALGGATKGGPDPLAMLSGFLASLKNPGPWDELERSPGASALADHRAFLTLSGGVGELDAPLAFFGGGQIPLRRLGVRLRELAKDPHLTGFVIRLGGLGISSTSAVELRQIFATLGKPVDCHVESLEGNAVIAAGGCTSLTLAPGGGVHLAGPYVAPLFLKGLFGKVGVEADFIQMGAYKGAAEALTRETPSPQMRETWDAIVEGKLTVLVDAIAAWRKVEPAKARAWVDHALFEADEAKQAGLVDGVQPLEAWRDAKGPWVKVDLEPELNPSDTLARLLGTMPRPSGPHVALLYAVGQIVDGAGSNGALGAREEIAPRRLVAAIRAAAADDSVKAIVLRIDSPGGSAMASEIIAEALEEAAAKKPLVASMGELAASGGYYIAAGAKVIYAQPDTLTGSIGVIGGKIVYGPALAVVGVNAVPFSRGAKAGMFSPVARFTSDEEATITAMMRATYDRFKGRVAAGRKLSLDEVEKIAQGRVWTGADALDRKLVDKLGGLDAALAEARELGGLPADAAVDVYPGAVTLRDLLSSLGEVDASTLRLRAVLGTLGVVEPQAAAAIAGALELALSFGREPVQTAVFLPALR